MSNQYFKARYLTRDGQPVEQLFFVATISDVRHEIMRANGTVQSITVQKKNWMNREYYSHDYKLGFLKGLSFQVDVGVSAAQALMHLIETEKQPAKRAEMQKAFEVITHGGQFADALAALPFMDKTLVVLLQTADASGSMQEAINDAAAIMESRGAAWKMLASAVGWIGFDLFSIISTVFGLQFYALPWFRENPPSLQSAEMEMQYVSRFESIASATEMLTVFTLLVAVTIVLFLIALFWGNDAIKDGMHRTISRMPLLRNVFIDSALADGLTLLSRMSKNGVLITHALELLAEHSWIRSVQQFWRQVRQALEAGQDVTRAFESAHLLTRQEIKAVSSHQNREQLANVLTLVARQRRADADAATRRFIQFSIGVVVAYMLIVMGIAMWLVSLQNMGLTGSFEDLMKGGF